MKYQHALTLNLPDTCVNPAKNSTRCPIHIAVWMNVVSTNSAKGAIKAFT